MPFHLTAWKYLFRSRCLSDTPYHRLVERGAGWMKEQNFFLVHRAHSWVCQSHLTRSEGRAQRFGALIQRNLFSYFQMYGTD